MEVKRELDFYDLEKECWSGAEDTLKTVREHNMEDELMDFLESYFGEFGETPTMTEVNDLLWFEDEWIFEQIGLEEEDDEDDDEYWDYDDEDDLEDEEDELEDEF